ncbi:uncharacterized protein H6S33_010384 [Morchella sextelata]|uniref:uncharacterized protein n=1 Tax=Morchella sextelata TaxID=1174677 RepID=UPI001D03DF60|nr:uncharacterized protein H6S33_010384 [Morchella sextelata]KAH0612332.1 hypothetical protein H6S33_010384 [Morchella sextelata]
MKYITESALVALTAFFGLASAAPATDIESRSVSCTVTSYTNVAAAKKACTTLVIDSVVVPAGDTLDLTDLLDGTTLTFKGTITFGYKEWSGPLVSVSGSKITVVGASGSMFDGDGSRWWDGEGSNGGKTKPKFFYAHNLDDSTITGVTLKNTPVQGFSINSSSNLSLKTITINNKDGDTDELGHNTDAFDVGSSDTITIDGATVYNQDDCLAVNSGTNIIFKNGYCSGGHGISIGSVGGRSDNTVDTVTISDSTIVDSQNGVRIKTVYDATGEVKGVTYSGITLTNITKYGIVIEQDYENGSPTGTPTTGVPITDLTISNVKGTVSSSGTDIYILCGSGACSDWSWSGVSITGGKTSSKCKNVPSVASC